MNTSQAIAQKISSLITVTQPLGSNDKEANCSYLGYSSHYIFINYDDNHLIDVQDRLGIRKRMLISMDDPDATNKAAEVVNGYHRDK